MTQPPAAGLSGAIEDEAEGPWEQAPDADAPPEVREITVPAGLHQQRLDKALAQLVPEFSRSYLQQLMALGAVRLQQRAGVKPAQKVHAGELVSVEMRPTLQSQAFRPEQLPLDVVYEDEHLLVVNKPAGLVVHPAAGHWSGTLLNALLGRDARAAQVPRAGIVHRLDKDTSGLMVVARSRAAMDALVRLIAAREVSRHYLALGWGAWSGPRERRVEAPIGRDPRNRLRMAVVDLAQHPGKPARTDLRLLDGNAEACLVHCALHTGRTHQIRVHMASLRHPLVADALYGGAPVSGLLRQALHAWRLAFVHPMTGQALEFFTPPPADLHQALAIWGLDYNAPSPRC
ncbi:ribosomal large subunit pseudouridine synthase D [Oryzisolibacter propanilivorax]|uniref:Pseudouridine synthase n=1 Tax=Oryzisolibacter propanilivorax TaxID=1527607 RepID=A0A1G9TB76_9BURK|nr:ribosomal large subunit pseudouridine synthase D [Oryzisolibacter propanilivorax]